MHKGIGIALTIGAIIGANKYVKAKNAQVSHSYNSSKGNADVQGDRLSVSKFATDTAANVVQKFSPINAIHQHVCGMHFYSGDMNRQVPAHHYCSHLNDDVLQCVIYDSDKADAKLIGIEYIISEKLFKNLPDEEKKLWHSHVYEVKSGMLHTPRVPEMMEKSVMKELVMTYGKTVHTWQIDRGDTLPLGIPQIMMAFTAPGQVNLDLVKARDNYYGINTQDLRKQRTDLPEIRIDPGADNWEKTGRAIQLQATEVKHQNYSRSRMSA